ncbi:MAG: hypothetical protein ACE5M4_02375 [Anaerolineales bacterium]
MKINQPKMRGAALVALSAVSLGAMTCSLPLGLGGQDPDARIATLEAELQGARSEATAQAGTAPAERAAETTDLEEDFEGESTIFQLGEGEVLQDGALLLGPYQECANDVANFDEPVGCMVVCQDCGRDLTDYRLRVNFTFEDGLSDREFGVILRLVDEDVDGLLDREDYLLALGFNVFDNRWRIYLHEPDRLEPWRRVSKGKAGFLQPGRMNELEVTVTEGGQMMLIMLNERVLDRLTGGEPEPGQRPVAPWMDSGAVGLIGLGRGVQARFDNFVITSPP